MDRVRSIAAAHDVQIPGSAIAELGAGVHNPLGSAVVSIGMGATTAIAVEPSTLEPSHSALAREVAAITLASIHDGPEEIRTQLSELMTDLKSQSSVSLINNTLDHIPQGSEYDIWHSNAVLEHVLPIHDVVKQMHSLTSPGGIHIHQIDYIDHRYYDSEAPDEDLAFLHLTKDAPPSTHDSNGLRHKELLEVFISCGFQHVADVNTWQRPISKHVLDNLADRYSKTPIEDLTTTAAISVFRKAA
jgi:hypothetical protein